MVPESCASSGYSREAWRCWRRICPLSLFTEVPRRGLPGSSHCQGPSYRAGCLETYVTYLWYGGIAGDGLRSVGTGVSNQERVLYPAHRPPFTGRGSRTLHPARAVTPDRGPMRLRPFATISPWPGALLLPCWWSPAFCVGYDVGFGPRAVDGYLTLRPLRGPFCWLSRGPIA